MFKQAAFPAQEKRLHALNLCSAEIFAYLEENLKLTPKNLSDKALASDELEEMYQQVLHLGDYSCYGAIFLSLGFIPISYFPLFSDDIVISGGIGYTSRYFAPRT